MLFYKRKSTSLNVFGSDYQDTGAFISTTEFEAARFLGPVRASRASQNSMEKVRALSERSELRSTHRIREAQGTPEGGWRPGSPSLFLSWRSKKESKRQRIKRKHHKLTSPTRVVPETEQNKKNTTTPLSHPHKTRQSHPASSPRNTSTASHPHQ